jgi:hypothetical protein
VDIWGFAATLLHMLTGSPPWQHDTLLQVCARACVCVCECNACVRPLEQQPWLGHSFAQR